MMMMVLVYLDCLSNREMSLWGCYEESKVYVKLWRVWFVISLYRDWKERRESDM